MKSCIFAPTETCESTCEWFINSPKHHNCFWTYVQEHSDADGTMEPLSQTKIAGLLGIKSSAAPETHKKALAQLKSLLVSESADEWLKEQEVTGFETLPKPPKVSETL